MRRAQCAELLVLDDLKVARLTDWTAGKIDDLIRARLNAKRVTVITSNESWNEMGDENNKTRCGDEVAFSVIGSYH